MQIANKKWNSLSNPDRILYQKSPHLIKNLALKDIAKLQEEAKTEKAPIQPQIHIKDDNLIKRPMNISKQEPAITLNKVHHPPMIKEPMRYQMQPEPGLQRQPNDHEGVMLTNGYSMSQDYNMSYNRIFPEGRSPPILDQRKRNRRLSSIVGVKSNPYGRELDFDEVLEPRNYEYTKPESRSASIDFTMAYEYGQEPQCYETPKRPGVYYSGIPNQSLTDRQFNQNVIFTPNPDFRRDYGRKQSTNLPLPDGTDTKLMYGHFNNP